VSYESEQGPQACAGTGDSVRQKAYLVSVPYRGVSIADGLVDELAHGFAFF